MIYVVISLIVMLGFASLAVDLGRVIVAKTQLRAAADAAARAGVAALPQGSNDAITAAVNMAAQNNADGSPVVLNASTDVVIGTWNADTYTFTAGGSNPNAVEVFARRTAATNNAVPLLIGQILGVNSCDTTASSIAALVVLPNPVTGNGSTSQYVWAHSNPWLAGEPVGTLASVPDDEYTANGGGDLTHPWKQDIALGQNAAAAGNQALTDPNQVYSTDYTNNEPNESPQEVYLSVTPGSVLQISVPLNSNNTALNYGFLNQTPATTYANGSNDGTFSNYSDDAANPSLPEGSQTTEGSEHGLSNIIVPINSMLGVFLDKNASTNGADNEGTPPPGVDFSTQAARDYTTFEPQLNQVFYVGNGSTSDSIQQTIVVPANAYAFYLGTMDGHEWSNNVGGFNATITQYQIAIVK
jgi:Flp pilus assembly protein TadG